MSRSEKIEHNDPEILGLFQRVVDKHDGPVCHYTQNESWVVQILMCEFFITQSIDNLVVLGLVDFSILLMSKYASQHVNSNS